MELVIDSSDLMSNPGSGVVLPRHVEALKNSMDVQTVMQAGLDALYQRNDPVDAVARFRRVLELNPTHYGATFQLAKALDVSGNETEALTWWKKVIEVAESIGDTDTATTARTRLGGGQ